jgi:acetylxylan esterase
MQHRHMLLLLLAASASAFPAKAVNKRHITCAPVHLIVARASGEAPGEGIIGAVSQDVQARVAGSDAESVDYPATLANYQASEAEGVTEMTRLVTEYAAACPDSEIVLMGYSQGGQVTMDVLCGTSSVGFPATEPLSADIASQISAVVVMGEPTFVPGEPYTVGDAAGGSVSQILVVNSSPPSPIPLRSASLPGDPQLASSSNPSSTSLFAWW